MTEAKEKTTRRRTTRSSGTTTTPRKSTRAAGTRKKSGNGARSRSKSAAAVSGEQRYRMIQEAAYYRAEKQGFMCDPWKCWLVAEQEIDAQIRS